MMNPEIKDNEKELNTKKEQEQNALTSDLLDDTVESVPKKKLPLVCKILYAFAIPCAILYVLFLIFPSFADIFNKYVSPISRTLLATLTGWIPFSLAEYLLLLIPVILVVVVGYGVKHYGDSWRNVGIFCLIIFSLVAYVFSTFTIGFVPAYRGSRLDAKMGLDKQEVTAEDLLNTATILVDKLEEEKSNIKMDSNGASIMPYSYDELNEKLMAAYDKACKKYDFIQPMNSRIKRIMLSEPMTYTHISGVYTFFTGEANLNTNFPDYSLPYTAAHEFAHQRGIAREDEANFVAFLVCIESDDAYIRYSGYFNLFVDVASALSSANREYYTQIYRSLPTNVHLEISAMSKFFQKYDESIVSNVSGTINNTFLTINGTEGTISYGMVVDLAVAYYKQFK